MAKSKSVYFCNECGAESPKWMGKCNVCGAWNSYVEEVVQKKRAATHVSVTTLPDSKPVNINEVTASREERIKTGDAELNSVLGGGLVPGSVVLVGGEPGIGKSTLLLQISLKMTNRKVLYVSGEESMQQIKMRADRTQMKSDNCYILTTTNTETIFSHIKELQPDVVVIDSIQTLHSDYLDAVAGSIGQIRQCTAELQHYAKTANVPVLLVGHITKDGHLAGPKVLEHIVDTVLQFEGDRNYGFRLLRSLKNRFGSTAEIGIYEMKADGMHGVDNPSEILLSGQDENYSGIAVAVTLEGIRPLLIELQALVSSAVYGTPQRSVTGFDLRRLNMLLAVLEKRGGFKLGAKDVFINVTGGIRLEDPATDLAAICAILSSSVDVEIGKKVCFSAEVGLSGEIRPVNRIDERINEAKKLGFEKIFVSKYNMRGIKKTGIEIIPVTKVEEVLSLLFK